MTIGGQLADEAAAKAALECYVRVVREKGGQDAPLLVDSALMYPNLDREGVTEKLLGVARGADESLRALPLASKANPWGTRTLTAAGVREQIEATLSHLGEPSIDIFYLHAPDHGVPIKESLGAVDQAFRDGLFKRFGLSNYAAWQVAEIVMLCEANGYVRPCVYQGMYNGITRDVERELFPALRNFGMKFYAYNVTAAGLLTGKHVPDAPPPSDGRFAVSRYQDRFWKGDYFEAVALVRAACDAANVTMVDAAHRWLVHHSKLGAGDAIIVGASKLAHIESNTAACFGEPLPDTVVDAFEQANAAARRSWPCYFR